MGKFKQAKKPEPIVWYKLWLSRLICLSEMIWTILNIVAVWIALYLLLKNITMFIVFIVFYGILGKIMARLTLRRWDGHVYKNAKKKKSKATK